MYIVVGRNYEVWWCSAEILHNIFCNSAFKNVFHYESFSTKEPQSRIALQGVALKAGT